MNSLLLAMRVARYAPRSLVRTGAWAGANIGWLRNTRDRQRYEDNLQRATGITGRELSRLSRAGMVSAARYYSEVLELARVTNTQADARIRVIDPRGAIPSIHAAGGGVIVLAHSGNWDLVGHYATRNIAPVTSVAEVVNPPELFEEFVALRAKIGLRIYGHQGTSTFRELLREAKGTEERIYALLADRDLSGTGVEVTMFGKHVKVAPGPAALAMASGLPLMPLLVHYERLHGARRRAARSRWGLVMQFGPVFQPKEFAGPDAVPAMSGEWAAWLGDRIAEHPEDWHMLQRFGWVE